ncbi:MAG: MATE family efflux transporter, partial [Bryobacterales bacterium]|nr:MATE family efflux transporter [Bryobacterales bacterium]
AYGARDMERCNHCLVQGLWIALGITPVATFVVFAILPVVRNWGVDPRILGDAIAYLKTLVWSILPLLLYVVFRRYLQSMNYVGIVMFALLSANLVNVFVNWLLIFGHWGFPALGVEGAGWATFFSRVYMAAVLLVFILYKERAESTGLSRASRAMDAPLIRTLLALGLPVALQISAEYGVFAMATALIARIDAVSLAAHQIVLNAASVAFMVPLGVSSAGAVRVGQAVGRRDAEGAIAAGWTAIGLGAAFMLCSSITFFVAPRMILRVFTTDQAIFAIGVPLLFLVACFQFFDGIQVTGSGVLRGIGDTKTPMIANLSGHWLVGLPVGSFLCFGLGWKSFGIWAGLSLGLIFVAIFLLAAWRRSIHRIDGIIAAASQR